MERRPIRGEIPFGTRTTPVGSRKRPPSAGGSGAPPRVQDAHQVGGGVADEAGQRVQPDVEGPPAPAVGRDDSVGKPSSKEPWPAK